MRRLSEAQANVAQTAKDSRDAVADAEQALRSTRALHLALAPHGLSWLVPRIAKHYGGAAHEVVRRRPYDLTSVYADA